MVCCPGLGAAQGLFTAEILLTSGFLDISSQGVNRNHECQVVAQVSSMLLLLEVASEPSGHFPLLFTQSDTNVLFIKFIFNNKCKMHIDTCSLEFVSYFTFPQDVVIYKFPNRFNGAQNICICVLPRSYIRAEVQLLSAFLP